MRTVVIILTIMSASLALSQPSELAAHIERYAADKAALERKHPIALSESRATRLTKFYESADKELKSIEFSKLTSDARVDYLLLQNEIQHELQNLKIERDYRNRTAPYLAFANSIIDLEEARRRFEWAMPATAAATLDTLEKAIRAQQKEFESALEKKESFDNATINRAINHLGQLKNHLEDWNRFYSGYDPIFTWWCKKPYESVNDALSDYEKFLREKVIGIRPEDKTTIIGFPIGSEALLIELAYEMIPYSPDELITIANKEFAWCEAEMKSATKALGFGDDWRKALEHVKNQFVEPGKQPELIRELAVEAISFLESKDLVTIPPLAKETWRMDMLSPEAQLQSPFFLGGERIQVSFPTDSMAHDAKLMSLRGNNRHFARATVQHELIPGHHLQQFMLSRHKQYRRIFSTPFWIEGWALYWEFLLYDLNFATKPEDKIGMLFWRMHRCARIIFSISFHLGKMTAQECVDFLVERVGHERDNAMAEVRRSFAGSYGPLYQAAYMLGGLQLRALHRELVGEKKMTNRQFHDSILKENTMPIELLRAVLTQQKLTRDFKSQWRFCD